MGDARGHMTKSGQPVLTAYFRLKAAYFSQIAKDEGVSGVPTIPGRHGNGRCRQRKRNTAPVPKYASDFLLARHMPLFAMFFHDS